MENEHRPHRIIGRPSPTTADHVLSDLRGRIAGCIDGGDTCGVAATDTFLEFIVLLQVGLESTVVDCCGLADEVPVLTILRPGVPSIAFIFAAQLPTDPSCS
jgi:L-threonylcarbamoyladenylate synthase